MNIFKILIVIALLVCAFYLFSGVELKNTTTTNHAAMKPITNKANTMPGEISKELIQKCATRNLESEIEGNWTFSQSEGEAITLKFNGDKSFSEVTSSGKVVAQGNWVFDKDNNTLIFKHLINLDIWDRFIEYYKKNPDSNISVVKHNDSVSVATKVARTTETGYSNKCELYIKIGATIYYKQEK